MKNGKLYLLTFFLCIISTTCLVDSGFSGEITRNRMNALSDPSGWDVKQWEPNGATIVPSDSPEGGTMARFRFPVGIADGSETANIFYVMSSPVNEAYVQFYHKYGTDFNWHPVGNKIIYVYSSDRQSAAFLVVLWGGLKYDVWGVNNELVDYNTGLGFPEKGVWYKYTIRMKANTSPGSHDGILQVWVDDVLRINRSDVMFFGPGTSAAGWGQFDMAPAYGGGGGANPSEGHSYYDDFIISTEPISGSTTPIGGNIKPSGIPNSPIKLEIR